MQPSIDTSRLIEILRELDNLELEPEQLQAAESFLTQLLQGLQRLRDLELPVDTTPRLYQVGARE